MTRSRLRILGRPGHGLLVRRRRISGRFLRSVVFWIAVILQTYIIRCNPRPADGAAVFVGCDAGENEEGEFEYTTTESPIVSISPNIAFARGI